MFTGQIATPTLFYVRVTSTFRSNLDFVGPFSTREDADAWKAKLLNQQNPSIVSVEVTTEVEADHGVFIIPPNQWPFGGWTD